MGGREGFPGLRREMSILEHADIFKIDDPFSPVISHDPVERR
jgi:hypothetical protein